MEGGAWKAAAHGVAEGQTRLSDFTFTFHFHALEKEMATHSSVLAWRIPGMGEPGGRPSMGSHRVGHNWSDLAAEFWLKFMSIESVMSSNHLILCRPLLLLLSIFPSIRVFSSELALCIRWPTYWTFSFRISPSNEYSGLISFRMDWFDLLVVHSFIYTHTFLCSSLLWFITEYWRESPVLCSRTLCLSILYILVYIC